MTAVEVNIHIANEADIVTARQTSREIALEAGLAGSNVALVATAVSELARNIVQYARSGSIDVQLTKSEGRRGIKVVARDEGPGIADIHLAMQDGYSTGGGLGLGLPGTKRMMDEFELVSQPGVGTTVTAVKWVPRAEPG
jgi:serine/threonine-protein kinase RsbT